MRRLLICLSLATVGCGGISPAPSSPSTSDLETMKAWSAHTTKTIRGKSDNALAERTEIDRANKQLKALVGKQVSWSFKVNSVSHSAVSLYMEFGWKEDVTGVPDAIDGYLVVTVRGQQSVDIGAVVSPGAAAQLRPGDNFTIRRKVRSAAIDEKHLEVTVDLE